MSMIRTVISLTGAQKKAILLVLDLLLVPLAALAAVALQVSAAPLQFLADNLVIVPVLTGAALVLSTALGLRRVRLKDYQIGAVLRTGILACLIGLCSTLFAVLGGFPARGALHVTFALAYFALYAGSRLVLLQVLLKVYRRSKAVTRVAIYGAGHSGMAIAAALKTQPDIVACVFLDDNAALRGLTVEGLPVHSGVHAARVRDRYRLDRVILAMPSLSVHKQTYLSKRLENLGLEVQTLPGFVRAIGDGALLDRLMPAGPDALLARDPLHDFMDNGGHEYRGANVLISGAGGSIGLELCRQILRCHPARLVLFELSEIALYNADAEMRALAGDMTEIVPVLGSVSDAVLVEAVLRAHQVQVVLHAAAYKHVPLVEANPRVGLSNNVLGTAVLAQKARDAKVRRFVLVSSDKAVRPSNVMGASKRMAELVVQDLAQRSRGTIFSIVRFGNVVGSSGSVIPLFQDQISRGGPVTLTDNQVTRYFMTITEAARLVLLAGAIADGGEVFVLDMGKPVLIRDVARQMIEAAGYRVRDASDPEGDIEIVVTGLRPGEKLHEELMVRSGSVSTAHPKIIRVREEHLTEWETASSLRALRDAIETGSREDLLAVLARAVRDYRPVGSDPAATPLLRAAERQA